MAAGSLVERVQASCALQRQRPPAEEGACLRRTRLTR